MTDPTDDLRNWEDARRVEAFAGEVRVNLIRLVAIVLFYGRHLVQFFLAAPGDPVRGVYHAQVTIVSLAWAAAVVVLHLMLTRRRVPPGLGIATALYDVLMITLLCCIAGGPNTPLMLLLFPAIASAPLRLSLKVVYATTAAAILGYLFVVGYYAWYLHNFHDYYANPAIRIPRSTEAIWILSLLVTGLFSGQVVRQARRLVAGYPVTVVRDEKGDRI
jgi:hypothetical protein